MAVSLTSRQRTLIIVAALVVILALVVWWFLGRGSRTELLGQAFATLDQAETYHVNAELVANLPVRLNDRERPITLVTGRVEGDVKKNEAGTPELTGRLFGELRGRGTVFYADGDLRMFNDFVAFRLDNLPVFFNPTGSLINRWTHVNGKILQTHNGAAVRDLLAQLGQQMRTAGTTEIDGRHYTHVAGTVSAELEKQLVEVLQHSASHNHGWNMVARLFNAYDLQSLEAWVDSGNTQLRRVVATFGTAGQNGAFNRRATLTIDITDYNKPVTLEVPPRQAIVQPEVFSRLFRTGQITPQ